MSAYYNEIDPFCVQWLRNLIDAGHIAPGDVDNRSIEDVRPADLVGYTQCHFFAGIGVWSYAARLAGWPDDRPLWTGSCPCQPFSSAGKGDGFADERHLWPAFFHLISQCRPAIVVGEQVASSDALPWIDLVQADLEGSGYASAAVDLCAAGYGAPHIRQRLYWVAVSNIEQRHQRHNSTVLRRRSQDTQQARMGSRSSGLAYADMQHEESARDGTRATDACGTGSTDRLGNTDIDGCEQGQSAATPARHGSTAIADGGAGVMAGEQPGSGRPGPTNGYWRDADWLRCRDDGGTRWRPVEPGTLPVANGSPARVGRLRAYGNAIVGPVAAGFLRAVMGSVSLGSEKAS